MSNKPTFFISKVLSDRLASGPFYCLGRAGMDLYPEPVGVATEEAEYFSADMGGSAANIAVALARLGGHVALLTVFSNDQVGRFVMAKCEQNNVNIDYCRTLDGLYRNSLAIAETKPQHASVVIYRNNAADLQISEEDVEKIDFGKAGGLVVTGTALSDEPSASAVSCAIMAAKETGCPIVIDIDYRPNAWLDSTSAAMRIAPELEKADIIIGNDDEFSILCDSNRDKGLVAAQNFAQSGKLVFYKKGELGCISLYNNHAIETGVFPVQSVKPFGAGDAFLGNVLMKLSQDGNVRGAVIQGSAAAAFVVARQGCASAMPDKQQLEQFMSLHNMSELKK